MPTRLTVFMMLRTTPLWLRLARAERRDFVGAEIRPILARYPAVRMRYFDAEALSGRCTDIAVWEVDDVGQYAHLIDALRDTRFFAAPYFEVVDIVPAIEDGWQDYDRSVAA